MKTGPKKTGSGADPISSAIGVDEVLLLVALLLVVIGLWPVVGVRALVAPGLILLYLTVPTRRPFVDKGAESAPLPAQPSRTAQVVPRPSVNVTSST